MYGVDYRCMCCVTTSRVRLRYYVLEVEDVEVARGAASDVSLQLDQTRRGKRGARGSGGERKIVLGCHIRCITVRPEVTHLLLL